MTRTALLATLLFACAAETPRTQVMVVIDADDGVRADTTRLRITVRSGAAFDEFRLEQTVGGEGRPLTWPLRVALVPQDGDASRVFDVEAEALSSTNERTGIVRARSGYVPRRTKELALLLEDCCRAVECSAEQTCRSCMCAAKDVNPEALPDLGRADAGAPPDAGGSHDAGGIDGGRDAGLPDTGPLDAGATDALTDAGSPFRCESGAACAPMTITLGSNTTAQEVCGAANAQERDGVFAGLARVELDFEELDGLPVTSCLTADFGEAIDGTVSVVGRRADVACGQSCSGDFCGTEVAIAVLVSSSAGGPWTRGDEYFGDVVATERAIATDVPFRFVMVCRGGAMTGRGHIEVDSIAATRR
ncbi:MAG: hypothetical protein H6722_13710 [Sandaracinus sp.]|nr:hypothetical protein [Sandaracinus sp.]MCB9613501.1 hypothetical protein [Sandaracinus sp.]